MTYNELLTSELPRERAESPEEVARLACLEWLFEFHSFHRVPSRPQPWGVPPDVFIGDVWTEDLALELHRLRSNDFWLGSGDHRCTPEDRACVLCGAAIEPWRYQKIEGLMLCGDCFRCWSPEHEDHRRVWRNFAELLAVVGAIGRAIE